MAKDKFIKLIEQDEKTVTVGGYGVIFDGEDLEGETFTPETDFMPDLVPDKLVLYDHTQGDVKHVLGKTVKEEADDFGIWVEAQLDKSKEYIKEILKLIDEKILGWSSGSVGHLIEREGKTIKRWPIVEYSLTPTPAEPRTLGVERLKKLAQGDPSLEALLPQEPGEGSSADATAGEKSGAEIKEKEIMSDKEKEVQAEPKEEIEVKAVVPEIDYTKLTAAMKPMVDEAVKAFANAPPEKPNVLVPKNTIKSKDGDIDPTEDYYNWLKTGVGKIKEHTVTREFKRFDGSTYKAALQEGTAGEGGYLVPAGELGQIIAKRDEASLLPKLGASMFNTDRDVFNIPTEGTAMTKFTIVAEEGAISGAENEPTFGQEAVTIYKFNKLIKVSDELLEDYNSGLDTFLNDAIGRAWGITENYYCQVGTGSSQPQGVFVGGTAALTLDAAAAIGVAEIPELLGKLKVAYRPGAKVLMNRTTVAYLRGLTGNQFQFAAPPISNVTVGGEDLNIGYPVFQTEDCAEIGSGNKSLLFGNFALYGWVRNRSLKVKRLVELYAGNGQVGILPEFRCGAEVMQAEAFQYATHTT